MKAYLNYFKIRLITNLQYRSAAIAGILTQLFFGFVYIMFYLALYESNSASSYPIDFSSLVSYLWLQQAFYAVTFPYLKDQELLNMISNGNLAYELIRPQNFYFKFYFKMLAQRVSAIFLKCPAIIVISLFLPYPYKLSLPLGFSNFILFVISMIASCLLVTSLSLLIHIITMFTLESKGLINTYSTICEVFMGGVIPLVFFPKWMISVSNYLPFRYIADFPYRVYSGNISIIEGKELLLGSIIWIIISIIIGYLVTKLALRKAVIQGG